MAILTRAQRKAQQAWRETNTTNIFNTREQAEQRHRDYVKAGRWKCPHSPTGGHHWLYENGTKWCKYCQEQRASEDAEGKRIISEAFLCKERALVREALERQEGLRGV